MKFSDVFKVQSVKILPAREGKRPQLQVEVATFGHTFRIYLDERFAPKVREGAEVRLTFAMRAGQYQKPEVYVFDVA